MNDKSKISHSGIGMDGAITPTMQRVFVGNGANIPQMQAVPTPTFSQQSSGGSMKHSSTTSSSKSTDK